MTTAQMEDVMNIFNDRVNQKRIHMLDDAHYTAWLLDPISCPNDTNYYLDIFESVARNYARGLRDDEDFDEDRFVSWLKQDFQIVASQWTDELEQP